MSLPTTIDELRRRHGGHWFDADTMRFFGTRFESGILHDYYFITSEQPPHGPRAYSVRHFNDRCDIKTLGAFCSHRTLADAEQALEEFVTTKSVSP